MTMKAFCIWIVWPVVAWAAIITALCSLASADVVVGSFRKDGGNLSQFVVYYDPDTGVVQKAALDWPTGSNYGFCMSEGSGSYGTDIDITFSGLAGEVQPCLRPDRWGDDWPRYDFRLIRQADDFRGIWERDSGPIQYDLTIASEVHTVPGDATLDGVFDSADLVQVFQGGHYENPGDLHWPDDINWDYGDFDLDGKFTSGDLLLAFQAGHYQSGAVAAVPEPSACVLLLVGLLCLMKRTT